MPLSLPSPTQRPHGDDPVSRDLGELRVGLEQALSAVADLCCIKRSIEDLDDHVLGDELQRGVDIAALPRLVETLRKLHILLRHRLLPQPGGFEGGGVVQVILLADHLA
jgi:hypothetical protein